MATGTLKKQLTQYERVAAEIALRIMMHRQGLLEKLQVEHAFETHPLFPLNIQSPQPKRQPWCNKERILVPVTCRYGRGCHIRIWLEEVSKNIDELQDEPVANWNILRIEVRFSDPNNLDNIMTFEGTSLYYLIVHTLHLSLYSLAWLCEEHWHTTERPHNGLNICSFKYYFPNNDVLEIERIVECKDGAEIVLCEYPARRNNAL